MPSAFIRSILSNLPDHRGLALLVIRDRIKNRFFEIEPSAPSESECFELSTLIEHYIKRYKLEVDYISIKEDENWHIQIKHLISVIDAFEPKLRAEILEGELDDILKDQDDKIAQQVQFGDTILSSDDKVSIHNKLQSVRKIIEQSELPDTKKNALFKRLNELALEVDRFGTKTDGFLGFVLELSVAAKKFHTNLKPAIDDIQNALQTIYVRKAKDEGIALPKQDDLPQLPKPEDFGDE